MTKLFLLISLYLLYFISISQNIIPRQLMGIQPLYPGLKTFIVNPQPSGLENIDIKIPTIRAQLNVN